MNSSMCHADATTHLKITVTALMASVLVVWLGIATHVSSKPATTSESINHGPSMLAGVAGSRIGAKSK